MTEFLVDIRQEQYAFCLAKGNRAVDCYFGIYGKYDEQVAEILAGNKEIRNRTEYLKDCIDNASTRE